MSEKLGSVWMYRRGPKSKTNALTIGPVHRTHAIWHGDSAQVRLRGQFDMVLCSPPYFHPSASSSIHGMAPRIRDLDLFAEWTANILARASHSLKDEQPLCFVKTDVKYNTLLPVGFRIAAQCEKLGMPIQAHWVWQRLASFSPYSPSLANIFADDT